MDSENGVLVSQNIEAQGNKFKASDLKVGDEILIKSPDYKMNLIKPFKVKVAGIIKVMPLKYNLNAEKYNIITTENVFKKVTGTSLYARFDIVLQKNIKVIDIEAIMKNIAARVSGGKMTDYTKGSKN